MKVFISWSGSQSQKVACALREWIPCVLQYVKPYVSSEDIDKGMRWSVDVAKELNDSSYGILCVTSDNQEAPWLNFEAGALSKAIDKSFVTPFLLNLRASDLKNGPLIQFQATAFAQEDVRKLVESINTKSADAERVDAATVKKTFDKWWPELEKELDLILQQVPAKLKSSQAPSKQETMLEELLELARSQQRHLSDPESVLPLRYLEWAFGNVKRDSEKHSPPIPGPFFHETLIDLIGTIGELEPSDLRKKAMRLAERLHSLYHEREARVIAPRRAKAPVINAAAEDTAQK